MNALYLAMVLLNYLKKYTVIFFILFLDYQWPRMNHIITIWQINVVLYAGCLPSLARK